MELIQLKQARVIAAAMRTRMICKMETRKPRFPAVVAQHLPNKVWQHSDVCVNLHQHLRCTKILGPCTSSSNQASPAQAP
jgi:hypothetical protein